jgi:flagellar protein FliS
MKKGLNAYHSVGIKSQVSAADPHRIIQMLMQGALDRIAQAKGCIERKEYAAKSVHVSKAIAILNALRESLKPVDGAEELSTNLNDLYVFVMDQIQNANVSNEVQPLKDSSDILVTIKEGWDAIPEAAKEEAYMKQSQVHAAQGF